MLNGRDEFGRFIKGRKETIDEKKKRLETVKKHYEEFIPSARLREENPYIFNTWRSIWYTEKGKKIGCSTDEWKIFENFYNDVSPTYIYGYTFQRVDKEMPFSKDNYIWVSREQALYLRKNAVYLEYKGEKLSLREISVKYNQPYNGIRKRYFSHKEYSVEEIIFGKRKNRNGKIPKDSIPNTQLERIKASKMISSYRCKDKKNGVDECDIDIDWMIRNIIHKPCIYCGDTHRIGCDRIDNSKGHTKENVVPCCYECNTARNNNFSFDEMKKIGEVIKHIKENRKAS